MKQELYTKKSMDKVSSPEQLNDYVRVSNPGVWMILSAVIILLAGVCVWGIFGHLDTKLETTGVCKNGTLTCYVREADIDSVKQGMEITVDGKSFTVRNIDETPIAVDDDMDSYVLHIGKLSPGEWVYQVTVDTTLEDGIYEASIVTESIKPMSFILN